MNDSETRAYEMLRWVPFSLQADFDEELAREGFYTQLQRQRSDQALNAWDRAHPSESSPELQAFRELERLGHLTPTDFYSPAKAKHAHYTSLLRRVQREVQGGAISPQERRIRRRQSRARI